MMSRRLALLLLLLAAPLVAQDQSLAPDDASADTTWQPDNNADCTATDCGTDTCEDHVGTAPPSDDDVVLTTATNNDVMVFDFPTPSANPATTASAQNFDIIMSRCTEGCVEAAAGTDPNFDLEMLCSGVSKTTIFSAQSITTLDERDATNTWTYTPDGDCDAAGANVQMRITIHRAGGGGNRRYPCIEEVEWEVTHAVASTRSRAHVIGN
jgi:hypothetical protein